MNRRDFLRLGLAGGALACGRVGSLSDGRGGAISLVLDPSDPVANAQPARWALAELQRSLSHAGWAARRIETITEADARELCIVSSGSTAPVAVRAQRSAGITAPAGPERLALVTAELLGRRTLVACGTDAPALTYALLELCDRLRHATRPEDALTVTRPIVEGPANAVRSVMRQFTSETLDTPWFTDREMWPRYLDMLATQRFNRLHLAFGLGYDSLSRVSDSYFLFVYPFLLSVPGHAVRVTGLTDAERDANLEMLRFISEETVARGIAFQLGIWTHGYRLGTGSTARHRIEGLTPETHAAYCRDAITALLRACPAISAVALRIHGESGIQEGSYGFWSTIFDGVRRSERTVEIDLHAKGIDQTMIDGALATGMPVNVSPKYWAEHLGMPYHQAAIRELEMPVPGREGPGLMTLSEGERSFTRYGYADLLRDDRRYTVRYRVFSGTQRLLLWGSPETAAAHARAFQFCGSTGFDLMEPLTCRGRRGTGVGTRMGYLDARLTPRWDWQKYTYWYRTWGRLTYNPDTEPEVWRREFAGDAGAQYLEASLSRASRILPIVTTAYLPSAACDAYWPEVYWNQPTASEPRPNPYGDSPSPRTFPNASPLDPQFFSRMTDAADEMLSGKRSGKYSHLDVAQWLDDLAAESVANLARAGARHTPERTRLAIDVEILAGLGRFFGARFRSGVLYAIHERTGSRRALEHALAEYRRARATWAALSIRTGDVYQADLSASDKISERGQWTDRLAAIDEDIASVANRLASATSDDDPRVAAAIAEALAPPRRAPGGCTHMPPAGFHPGSAVTIELNVETGHAVAAATLYYRHVNQAERYQSIEMQRGDQLFRASIPAGYTASPFPLQYYFAVGERTATAWLYPGFAPELSNQPYFLLRRR